MSTSIYFPELYDAVNRGDHDVRWYRDLAVQLRGPVLELGCGTGRTLLPIAREGIPIDGLDLSPEMLSSLRDKLRGEPAHVQSLVRIFEADMAGFAMDRQYRLIQIPFRAFLHNTTRDSQLACLRACRDALAPGGTLAFNVFFPSLEYMALSMGPSAGVWRTKGQHRNPAGELVLFSEWNEYSPATQTVRSLHRFETFDARGQLKTVQLQELNLAYLYPGDLRELLGAAGLREVQLLGGFDGGPLTSDKQEIVVLASG